MYLVKSLSWDKGPVDTQCICPFHPTDSVGQKGRIHCVSSRPLVREEGLYQIHGQSLTHIWVNTGLGVPKIMANPSITHKKPVFQV